MITINDYYYKQDWEHDNSSLGRPMLASHWPSLGNHLVLQARLMHDLYTQTQYKRPPYARI